MSNAKSPSEPMSVTMYRPSVAGVADAWLALTCRFMRGTPSYATVSHTTLPDCLSMAINRQVCLPLSLAGSMPDLLTSPSTTPGFPSAATAVVR